MALRLPMPTIRHSCKSFIFLVLTWVRFAEEGTNLSRKAIKCTFMRPLEPILQKPTLRYTRSTKACYEPKGFWEVIVEGEEQSPNLPTQINHTDDNAFVIVDSPSIHQCEPRIRLGLVKNIRLHRTCRGTITGESTRRRLPAFPGALQNPNHLDLMNMRNMCLLSEEISAFLDYSCSCDPSVVAVRY